MTRKEYMEQLKKYLKRLPKEDYENVLVTVKTSPRKKQQLCRQQVHITERAPMHIAGQIQET